MTNKRINELANEAMESIDWEDGELYAHYRCAIEHAIRKALDAERAAHAAELERANALAAAIQRQLTYDNKALGGLACIECHYRIDTGHFSACPLAAFTVNEAPRVLLAELAALRERADDRDRMVTEWATSHAAHAAAERELDAARLDIVHQAEQYERTIAERDVQLGEYRAALESLVICEDNEEGTALAHHLDVARAALATDAGRGAMRRLQALERMAETVQAFIADAEITNIPLSRAQFELYKEMLTASSEYDALAAQDGA